MPCGPLSPRRYTAPWRFCDDPGSHCGAPPPTRPSDPPGLGHPAPYRPALRRPDGEGGLPPLVLGPGRVRVGDLQAGLLHEALPQCPQGAGMTCDLCGPDCGIARASTDPG